MGVTGRLEHVGVAAAPDKFEQNVAFYTGVFGWHVIKEAKGQLAFIGDGDGGRIEMLCHDAPPLPAPHHLAFVVDPGAFDETVTRLRDAGATVGEPSTNPFGDRLLFFEDPAGNRAQIVARRQPLEP
jgi:catechol 2,3-dioxygenase-like lactoylglutathione lyase family enzyme